MRTINALMKHLRANGVQINGSYQKNKLRKIGYFHGYKGHRFARRTANRLPINHFDQVVLLYDFDLQIKALLYSRIMSVETALKNRVLEAVLKSSKSEDFDVIYRHCLTSYKCHQLRIGKNADAKKAQKVALGKRLALRTEIDRLIAQNHSSQRYLRHYLDQDKDIPIWALFEMMTLGTFGVFYNCLHDNIKIDICNDLNMPVKNFDCPMILSKIIFAFKDLRNAVAHNGVVLDTRFKTGNIKKSVRQFLNFEMNIQGIVFREITDYVLLITYLMARLGFTKTECKQLLREYQTTLEKYRAQLPYNIYSQLIGTQANEKLASANNFIRIL